MNTVPYTNARRAGRTHPDMIEMITPTDPRVAPKPAPNNRATLRRRGIYRGVLRHGPKAARSRCLGCSTIMPTYRKSALCPSCAAMGEAQA